MIRTQQQATGAPRTPSGRSSPAGPAREKNAAGFRSQTGRPVGGLNSLFGYWSTVRLRFEPRGLSGAITKYVIPAAEIGRVRDHLVVPMEDGSFRISAALPAKCGVTMVEGLRSKKHQSNDFYYRSTSDRRRKMMKSLCILSLVLAFGCWGCPEHSRPRPTTGVSVVG